MIGFFRSWLIWEEEPSMFFKLAGLNVKRSIRNYLIYFSTLIVAIASFYIILSIGTYDIVQFLQRFESKAIQSLFGYVRAIYIFSLVIMFFMICFANSFLIRQRRRELGLYLTFGMKRLSVFRLLLIEGLCMGVLAFILGLGIGIFLSEMISLLSVRLFDLNLLGHRFRISPSAVFQTGVGFGIIQIFAVFLQSGMIFRSELSTLLSKNTKTKSGKILKPIPSILFALVSMISLAAAYLLLVKNGLDTLISAEKIKWFFFILVLGLFGVFGIFYSIPNGFLTLLISRPQKYFRGLRSFTSRQITHQISLRYKLLSLVSLLLFLAICLFSIGFSFVRSDLPYESSATGIDMTVMSDGWDVEEYLSSGEISNYIGNMVPVQLLYAGGSSTGEAVDTGDLISKIEETQGMSIDKESFASFQERYRSSLCVLKISEYNRLLQTSNLPEIILEPGEASVFIHPDMQYADFLEKALPEGPVISIGGDELRLTGDVHRVNFVADRLITIIFAVIVEDSVFDALVPADPNPRDIYYNIFFPDKLVEEQGKIAITEQVLQIFSRENTNRRELIRNRLAENPDAAAVIAEEYPQLFIDPETGEPYHETEYDGENMYETDRVMVDDRFHAETALQSTMRQLVYVVSGSFLFIYLGIVFLLVCAMLLSLLQITEQRENQQRYRILAEIGASPKQIKDAVRSQICLYFGLPLLVALLNSAIGAMELLKIIGNRLPYSLEVLIPQILFIGGFLVLIYGVYWLITLRNGYKIVGNAFLDRRESSS